MGRGHFWLACRILAGGSRVSRFRVSVSVRARVSVRVIIV